MEVNKVGRPKEHDREKLAEELIEWSRLPESINLNEFAYTRNPELDPTKISRFAKENEQFCQSLNIAKARIAVRREKQNSLDTLSDKAYCPNLTHYDLILRQDDMEKAEIELDRKIRLIEAEMKLRAQTNQVDDEIISNHSELMHQLTKLQNDYIKRSRTTQP